VRLHEFVSEYRVTQVELARRLGVSQSYISEVLATERGEAGARGRRPSPELAARIVEVTGGRVTLEEVLFPCGIRR